MKLIQEAMLYVEVTKAGSFTQAALLMNSSKSQISRRISQLEQRLNAQLFIRTQQGLQLTEAGKQFYQSCLQIQSDFDNATQSIHQDGKQLSGKLVITAPITLGSLIVGPLLAEFMRNFPNLAVELDLSDRVKDFSNGSVDIALRAARQLPNSNLIAKKLFSYGYVVCASPDYLQLAGTPKTPYDLEQHRTIGCVTQSISDTDDHWAFIDNAETIKVPIQPIAKVTHMGVQKHMALEDQGIIRVPDYWVTDEIENGSLIPLLESYSLITSHLFAVYPKLSPQPQKTKAFIDYLTQHLTPTIVTADANK
ncbi:MAG: LysR substrate-binding domain-containing protein [Coxiellaceae bacterium]|nr:LysR substrate-binding domain-containing protein [Coxiellaceae bacterium]